MKVAAFPGSFQIRGDWRRLRKYEDGFECVKSLGSLGYLYKGECGVPGRHYFRTNNDIVKFHISMFPVTSEGWKDHILFRDYLNQNPDVAKEYEELKIKLMNEFAGDRVRYTESKDPFIKNGSTSAGAYLNATLQATTPEVRRLFAEHLSQSNIGQENLVGLALKKNWMNPYDIPENQILVAYKQSQNIMNEITQ